MYYLCGVVRTKERQQQGIKNRSNYKAAYLLFLHRRIWCIFYIKANKMRKFI